SLSRAGAGSLMPDSGQAERRQLAQHVGAVRGRPVEPPAAGTGEEALVALVDEARDAARGALARHLVEHAVAVEAAPEERHAPERDRGGDLAELLAEVVAGHEDVRRQLRIALEARVARQDEPPLLPRAAHQRPAREVRAVGH